jgi:hypothetical protein
LKEEEKVLFIRDKDDNFSAKAMYNAMISITDIRRIEREGEQYCSNPLSFCWEETQVFVMKRHHSVKKERHDNSKQVILRGRRPDLYT